MRSLLGCLLLVPILAQAEPVNYFDKNGKLFMQSNRVGNQVIYTDPVGNLVATQNPVATPVIPVMMIDKPKANLGESPYFQLPQLPTLDLLK